VGCRFGDKLMRIVHKMGHIWNSYVTLLGQTTQHKLILARSFENPPPPEFLDQNWQMELDTTKAFNCPQFLQNNLAI
jgi:hypothetical protein